MKSTWLIRFLLFSFAMTTEARALNDNCSRLPGLWFGTYTLKRVDDCTKAGACKQMLSADIKALSKSTYEIALSPPMVGYQRMLAICENGELKLPLKGDYNVSLTCQEGSTCSLVFNNKRLDAAAIKINNQAKP